MKFQTYRPKIQFEKNGIEILALTLHIIVFVIGGFLLARLIWVLFAPSSLVLPSKLEQTTSSHVTTILAAHWFTPTNGQIVIPVVTVNFKLVGIYASTNTYSGFAVFKLANGKQKAVLLNQEINLGINLQNVYPDHVEVGQQGATQKLYLDNPKPPENTAQVFTPRFKKL